MEQWEEIYRLAKEIIRRRGRVYAREIWETGEIYYHKDWIHDLLQKMVAQGMLVKAPRRGGFRLTPVSRTKA